MSFHDENYQVITDGIFGKGAPVRDIKKILDDKNGRCRFCGKSADETTFKNVSHAIPVFLGNRNVTTKNECDKCNEFFSNNIENHFDRFSRYIRSYSFINGRKSAPSHRQGTVHNRLDPELKDGEPLLHITDSDGTFAKIDIDNKNVQISIETEPFSPAAVYRFFLKLFLTLVPQEYLSDLNNTLKILMSDSNKFFIFQNLEILETRFSRPPINGLGFYSLLKKVETSKIENPEYLLLFGFSDRIYQVPVFSDKAFNKSGQMKITMCDFANPFRAQGDQSFSTINLSSEFSENGRSDVINIGFESINHISDIT